ncbi:hypothetical protein ACOMHN_014766 [Nucella lapillus]
MWPIGSTGPKCNQRFLIDKRTIKGARLAPLGSHGSRFTWRATVSGHSYRNPRGYPVHKGPDTLIALPANSAVGAPRGHLTLDQAPATTTPTPSTA